MELIDKIQEYVHGVCNKERKIRSDKEDYSHGKFSVASVVSKIIEDHEPEPPKTPTEIATKYVKGQHEALTDNQEIKDLAREIEAYKKQPPKLRPMSELPATKSTCVTFCNFLVEHNSGNRYYMNGHYFKSEAAGTYACIGDDTPKPFQGWIFGEYKLIGWLPSLPNPNDIKL